MSFCSPVGLWGTALERGPSNEDKDRSSTSLADCPHIGDTKMHFGAGAQLRCTSLQLAVRPEGANHQ